MEKGGEDMCCDELLNLFGHPPFDDGYAEELIRNISDLNQPFLNGYGFFTTYLYEAQSRNDLEAVRFLLENGADPNVYDERTGNYNTLWDLQYEADDSADNQKRLEIAKLMLEYGADPCIRCDGEALFDYCTYKIYHEIGEAGWEYLCKFYILLIAYGGGAYPFVNEIDKSRIEKYRIKLQLCEDGYHLKGFLMDPDNQVVGEL